jgi:hypothetical protein
MVAYAICSVVAKLLFASYLCKAHVVLLERKEKVRFNDFYHQLDAIYICICTYIFIDMCIFLYIR